MCAVEMSEIRRSKSRPQSQPGRMECGLVQCKSLHVSWKSALPLPALGICLTWSVQPRKRFVSLQSRLLRLVSESLSTHPHFCKMEPSPEVRRDESHPYVLFLFFVSAPEFPTCCSTKSVDQVRFYFTFPPAPTEPG